MINDKRGSSLFVMLSLAIIFFVLGMALASPIRDVLDEAMDNEQLNCTDPAISQQNEAVCTSIDMFQPLLVGMILGLAGLLIGRMAT